MNLSAAVDLYLGEIARRYRPATERKYGEVLGVRLRSRVGAPLHFLEMFEHRELEDITQEDCERFLNQWAHASKATMALHTSIIRGFFEYHVERGRLEVNPAGKIKRPKLPKPQDRKVKMISTE